MEEPREGEPVRLVFPSPTPPKAGTIVTVSSGGIRRRYLVLASQPSGDGVVTAQVLDWPAFKVTPNGQCSPRLFSRLRAWRLERARDRGVAAYVVATDATLTRIAASRPRTLGDLARISGVGPQFVVMYGTQLLAWLSDEPHEAADDAPETAQPQAPVDGRAPGAERRRRGSTPPVGPGDPQLSAGIRLLYAVGRPIPSDQPLPTDEAVWAVVQGLTPRTRKILSMRFGREGPPMTLEEIGRHFNLTRERIRQIVAKAFRMLGHPSRWNRMWTEVARGDGAVPHPESASTDGQQAATSHRPAHNGGPSVHPARLSRPASAPSHHSPRSRRDRDGQSPGTAAVLTIALRSEGDPEIHGEPLEQAVLSTLAACRQALSSTQLAHILLGSSGPRTTELHERFNFPAFGVLRGSALDSLKADVMKLAEARPADFIIRPKRYELSDKPTEDG